MKCDLGPVQVKVKGQGHKKVDPQMCTDVFSICVKFQASVFGSFS